MKIIEEGKLRKLIPTEKQGFVERADYEKPQNEWNFHTLAYIPNSFTIEMANEKYIEVDEPKIKEEEDNNDRED